MTCYPEGVIWNAVLDDWGLTLRSAEMHAAREKPGSLYSTELSACPDLDELRAFSKNRQARRRSGLVPQREQGRGVAAPGDVGGAPQDRTKRAPRDEPDGPSETVFDGAGKRLLDRCRSVDEVLLGTGFLLYTLSSANPRGVWPPMDRMRGALYNCS